MDEHVLDSSAALAAALNEPGWRIVRAVSSKLMSSVNYTESISSLLEKGRSLDDARELLEILQIQIVAFDLEQALEAARLRPLTRPFGLSLGDRACLALAKIRDLPVLTADRAWTEAAPHLTINVIR